MKRREFMKLIGSAAVSWPLAARAQPAAMPVIGYLSGWSPGDAPEYLTYFRRGWLKRFHRGPKRAMEFRFAGGHFERLPELVAIWFGVT